MEDFSTCDHRIIELNGLIYCDLCSTEFDGNISYSKMWNSYPKSSRVFEKNSKLNLGCLREELKFLDLNEDILASIFDIYVKMTNYGTIIYRCKVRKSILCASIKHVFDLNKVVCDEDVLMRQFELDKKSYSKGVKKLKLTIPETRYNKHEVASYLRNFSQKLNIESHFSEEIEQIYLTIKAIHSPNEDYDEGSVFKDLNPKTIAAVVIYYWLKNYKNVTISFNNFSSQCCIPKYSLSKVYKSCSEHMSLFLP